MVNLNCFNIFDAATLVTSYKPYERTFILSSGVAYSRYSRARPEQKNCFRVAPFALV